VHAHTQHTRTHTHAHTHTHTHTHTHLGTRLHADVVFGRLSSFHFQTLACANAQTEHAKECQGEVRQHTHTHTYTHTHSLTHIRRSVKIKASNDIDKRRGRGWLKVKSAHSVLCWPPFSVYVVAGLLLARALIGSTQVKQRPSKKVIVAEDFRVRETFPTNHAPAFL
jgi:hypothetical protein